MYVSQIYQFIQKYFSVSFLSGQVVGIKNLGYTCFLNSLLQSLSACPAFIEWLRKRQDNKKPESFTNNLMNVIDGMLLLVILIV